MLQIIFDISFTVQKNMFMGAGAKAGAGSENKILGAASKQDGSETRPVRYRKLTFHPLQLVLRNRLAYPCRGLGLTFIVFHSLLVGVGGLAITPPQPLVAGLWKKKNT